MRNRNKLLKLFIDNAAKAKRYEVKATDEDEATVYLYDAIGSWWGIDAAQFVKDLNAIQAKTIHLRINSPGGDVFDARAIKTTLQQHPATIVSHIDGLAASAATYIALGADTVEIAKGGFFMIHNAWTLALGNANELREVADLLDKVDASIVADYLSKTGQDEDQIKSWMAAETWFSAEEAMEHGFVDSVFDADNDTQAHYDLTAYDNAPKELLARADNQPKAEDAVRQHTERRLRLLERG